MTSGYVPDVITEAVGSEPTYQMAVDQMAVEEYAKSLSVFWESYWSFIYIGRSHTEIICWYRHEAGIWLGLTQLLSYSITQFLFRPPHLQLGYKLKVYFLYYIFNKYIIYYLYKKKHTVRIKLSNWVTE